MLGGGVLALCDPLPAVGAANRAHPSAVRFVKPTAIVDRQAALAAECSIDDLLDPVGVKAVDVLVVERRRDGCQRALDLHIASHVIALTRAIPAQTWPVSPL